MRVCILCFFVLGTCLISAQQNILFVGTYNSPDSTGVHVVSFDSKNGKLKALHNLPMSNPSYLAIAKNGKHIYAVLENKKDSTVKSTGELATLAFDAKKKKLKLLSRVSTNGSNPCYVTISNDGKTIITANYSSGTLSVHHINNKGIAGAMVQEIVHEGKSIHARQQSPHIHGVFNVPGTESFLVTDLGTDEVSKYSPNKNSVLEKAILLAYKSKAGNGPRHLAFGKTADIVYVLNELSNTIDVLRNKNGKLTLVHTCSVLPDTVTTTPTAADIHVSDDKKFLYSSIRGEVNAIGVFSLANPTKPVLVQHIKSGGWTPRNFVIHPSGKYLLVAHQNSNNIVVFKRDAKNGMLTTTNEFLNIGKPVCLKWLSDK